MKILNANMNTKTQIEQAAKKESATTWPLEKLLYGGGLSKAKKGANKGKVSDDLVMFLDYTTNAARNFVMQTFYPLEFTNLANNPEGLSNTKPAGDTLNDVAILFDRVRVRKDKVGRNLIFTLAFPVYQTKLMITVPPVGMVNTLQYNDVTNAFAEKALAFSDKFFNVDRELDITVPADRILSNVPRPTGENADKILSARSGFLTEFKRSIKSFRVMAPSITVASKAARSQQTFINDEGTSFQPLDLDEPDFNMVNPSPRAHVNRMQFIKWAAENRVITVYVNAVIPEAMVLGITENTDLNQVKLQTVSSWFKNSSLSHYTRGDVARADSVVDISRISERNKTTKILETKRTNADGLCITRSGIIYYLPEIDRALEYETEVEKDNLRDDGDFCTSDTKNPENLRYTEVQDPDGTTRRVRGYIPKRANELLYLDLKYGRLSYTDTNGTVQVMSIEEWRPVTTNNIYETLSHKFELGEVDELSKRGQFQAGIELIGFIAKAHGFNASDALRQTVTEGTPLYETYRPVLDQIEARLVKGEIRAALMHVAFVLNYASNNKRHYGNDIPLTEQELEILNEYESGGLTLNLIGPDSPITPLQVIYQMVEKYLEYVNADMKEAFHDRSVMTHLRSYALAIMITKYHGKEPALRVQDQQERKEYINPDPVDIHNVDIAGIPFIRGQKGRPFTLMPHQVTAWTQMRNAPPNLVLDVAAGGGKTLLCIIDILYMIGNKKLDGKPLVMCPGHLVKQYFSDVAYATGGSVNVVAITSETMKAWDEEKMAYTIENAPVNTIFITDYSFLSQTKSGMMGYGNRPIQIVYAAEFLRQFKWGGLWLDESHYLKNQASLRTKAVARLIAGIPFKRQMSGTYAPDTHKDVAGQYALLDPTTFGTEDDFLERYWDEENRCWRTGSAVEIKTRMNQYAKIVKIKRAAWAAFLPPRIDPETGKSTERFLNVKLNDNQQTFYNKLLEIMRDELNAKMLADPKLRAMIEKAKEKAEDDDEADETGATSADEEFEEKLMDKFLHSYVQRLEQFLTAPGSDEAGKEVLLGEDAISPKAKAVAWVIQDHINRGIEGKILVFTQYVESGAALVASLPAELKARTIHYVADPARRDAILREFQVNPKLIALIGCEKSLNTGLNLQFCSRLIRVESVWNWGTLEQGESRVNRPNPKSEFRKALYFDWIYCNFTLDVTKMSKLFSKCLESAKFNNEEDNRFQQLPTLYSPRLNPDVIFAMNDAESEDPKVGLLEHFSAFQTMRQLEEIQYEEYRNDPNVRKEPLEVPDGEILEGSGFLKEVPYVADMQLYSPSELNLIPYIDYASSHGGLAGFDPTDIKVHTEFGDGVVVKANRDSDGKVKNLRVQLSDGKQTVAISKTWVIDIKSVSQKTIRRAIMEGVVKEVTGVEPEPEFQAKPKRGRPVKVLPQSQPEETPVSQEFDMQDEQDIPLDEEPIQDTEEPTVPERRVKVLKQRPAVRQPRAVRKPREEEPEDFNFDEEPKDDGTFSVEATSIMEALCLYVDTSDPDVPEKELMRDGWIHLRPTASFRVNKPQILQSWWKKVHAHFIVPEPFNTMMKRAIDKMIKMPKKTFLTNITTQQLRNFMLQEARPAKAGEVKPYLLVQARGSNVSPSVRVAIDMKGNREWRKLSQIKVPGMEPWETDTGDGLFRIFKQRAQAISYAKQMSRKFKVDNLSEVTQALKSIYVVKHEEEEDWA